MELLTFEEYVLDDRTHYPVQSKIMGKHKIRSI